MSPRKQNNKKRLDVLLFERGFAESRQKSQAIILAGEVLVDNQKITKAGERVKLDAVIQVIGTRSRYVGRGGLKLQGALEDFQVTVRGRICLDVGSSTGGFTDCLLQDGAARVYALDVTIDQLDWKLQNDPRVISIQKNARELKTQDIPEPVEFVTIDVSFISLQKILTAVTSIVTSEAECLILIKPQFELERCDVGKGGIVRDPRLHEKAIARVKSSAIAAGLAVLDIKPSRLTGAEGNQEFFLHARRQA
ncbi:MAG TPA: TlyA family RNA methyltransferase [Candidatus Dormibacteraeota bacterium]|nr:TlyA family RNA methyltransferase [Candidatus Dormibacteraeota bacterium]